MLENIKELRCILGTPQCLTIAAWAVTGQFTKLTLSLRRLLTMMNVSVLKPPFVGGFQESILKIHNFVNSLFIMNVLQKSSIPR